MNPDAVEWLESLGDAELALRFTPCIFPMLSLKQDHEFGNRVDGRCLECRRAANLLVIE